MRCGSGYDIADNGCNTRGGGGGHLQGAGTHTNSFAKNVHIQICRNISRSFHGEYVNMYVCSDLFSRCSESHQASWRTHP